MSDPITETTDRPTDLVAASLDRLVARTGGSEATNALLFNEARDLREKIREITARLPADGSVVLSADDAKLWGRYRELGDAAELRTAIAAGTAATNELTQVRRAQHIAAVAQAAGANAAVLGTLIGDAVVEIRDHPDAKGKPTPTAVIVNGETVTPLRTYAEADAAWRAFLPALFPDGTRQSAAGPQGGTPPRTTPLVAPSTAPAKTERMLERARF